MAEDSDLEKTEQATAQRLEKAREDGDVPRSRELATFTGLMAAGTGLWMSGGNLVSELKAMLVSGMSFTRDQVFDMNLIYTQIGANLMKLLVAFAPLAGLLILVALLSPALIGGWLFSNKALVPNFGRMNPIKGLSNMVSTHALVELVKAVAKATLVGVVAWMVMLHEKEAVMALGNESVQASTAHVGQLLWYAFISMTSALGLIVAIDAPYQMYHYAEKLKMTREEVRQEAKEADGNPQVKAKIRQQQREMARRRMMSEVPTADVVVTNPTHYAVALRYVDGGSSAPIVVAKGADEVAAKIREIAAANNIPTLEAPPLARALYQHTDLGEEIPQALYTAVAEILAYVFQLRSYRVRGGVAPTMPKDIDVPAELDPLNPAAAKPLLDGMPL
ncbi:flagellar biosynthesis protein FlhB [Sulfuriferula nivalis]|uniref:Flagellar biosynthetic protein FlhB n=1 Tax=Sulfuriferula nivalis TaxID=2675298 RepID=A0A809S9U0_9PROT|nr:flagellar biosynthesis protein FlhB [Sulfuriferula nivalis]BBP01142.1 flagellar biosynthesis protein FlhB [Sulfuriferula nivalis]